MLTPLNRNLTKYAGQVDAPASDEIVRAKELASYLAQRLRMAKKYGGNVSLRPEEAEELCQLLHDSIRTAEQLRRNHGE